MTEVKGSTDRPRRSRAPALLLGGGMLLLLVAGAVLTMPDVGQAALDICGCIGSPRSLGPFDTTNPATYPPGTRVQVQQIDLPVPPDGVFVFTSFRVVPRPVEDSDCCLRLGFIPNERNTPVTILVSGDVEIGPSTNVQLVLNGSDGESWSGSLTGRGGAGGPGGFPGGQGAYQLVNFAAEGGDGLGPAGGAGAPSSPLDSGGHGGFVGSLDLLPLVGGSGGGGGASTSNDVNCGGGGGGGGGGALLIAANGTITVNGYILAQGGNGGSYLNPSCASYGGGGSGGAIRLLASTITSNGNGGIFATPGSGFTGSNNNGAIRLEAFSNTFPVSGTNPVASRAPAPGPLALFITPTVAITAVGGQPVPVPPRGVSGAVDVILPVPGVISIDYSTKAVPSGTIVNVVVKPRVGGPAVTFPSTLNAGNCTSAGVCVGTVAVDLPPGAYVIEARATFQTP